MFRGVPGVFMVLQTANVDCVCYDLLDVIFSEDHRFLSRAFAEQSSAQGRHDLLDADRRAAPRLQTKM